MGKTYRRDQANRPKKHGQIFIKDKDKPWKKGKQFPKPTQYPTGSAEELIDYT